MMSAWLAGDSGFDYSLRLRERPRSAASNVPASPYFTMTTINEIFSEIEKYPVLFENRYKLHHFLFEYACQTVEWEGTDPKNAGGFIRNFIHDSMRTLLGNVELHYSYHPDEVFPIRTYPLESIPDAVRKDHGGGVPISHYEMYKLLKAKSLL